MRSNDDKTTRSRPGQGQIFEAEAEAKIWASRATLLEKVGVILRINNVILPLLVDPKILRKTAI